VANTLKNKSDPRQENLARLVEAAKSGDERVDAYPVVLYLEATATCNLRCPMCPTTMGLPRDPYRTDMLDLSLLPKLEAVLPNVVRCFLSGGGEPLLHPRFFDILAALKKHDVEVLFNCNATLLDEDRARRLIQGGADTISFSIDGATKETYEQVRIGANFERVTKNVRRLAEIKKELGSGRPCMNMQFTLLDINAHEARAAVELAASIGVNHLVVEPLTPVFGFDPEYAEYYQKHKVEPEQVIGQLRLAAEDAERLGLVFSSHYLFAADNPEPEVKCREPWLTFGVRVDGRVFTCCGMLESMGDLAEQTFDEIWNGPAYLELRRELAAGRFPDCCKLCVAENRANHFNEDLLGL